MRPFVVWTVVALAEFLPAVTHAQGCPEPQAHQFDFWRGDWNVNNRYLVEGTWRDVGLAEVRVFPVVGGCGVVELWDGMLGRQRIRGFSARSWNPSDSTWTLVLNWPQPNRATFSTLTGTFRHGRGDFITESTGGDGLVITRYTFSDISQGRFRWNDGISRDSGATWRTQWIMEYSRRDQMSRPLMNAAIAAAEEPICNGEISEATRRLHGRWRNADGVSLIAVPAIGQCATLIFLDWAADGARQEWFAIIGYDYRAGHWTAWTLSTQHRGFQELTGAGADSLSGEASTALVWRRADGILHIELMPRGGDMQRFDLRRPGA
jgi:hypothetical protein